MHGLLSLQFQAPFPQYVDNLGLAVVVPCLAYVTFVCVPVRPAYWQASILQPVHQCTILYASLQGAVGLVGSL